MNDDDYPFIVKCPECNGELEEWFESHYNCKKCGNRYMTFKDIKKKKEPKQKDMSQFF